MAELGGIGGEIVAVIGATAMTIGAALGRVLRRGRKAVAGIDVLLSTLESVPCAVLIFDAEQQLVFSTTATPRVFGGVQGADFDWRQRIHREDAMQLEGFQSILESARTDFATIETRYLGADGRYRRTRWCCVQATNGATLAIIWPLGYA